MPLRPLLSPRLLALVPVMLLSLSAGQAAPPVLQPGDPLDTVEDNSYNISFVLRADDAPKDASAGLIFGREEDRFYALELSRRGTALLHCANGKARRLAKGGAALRGDGQVEVVIKRRPVRLRVEAGRELLLEVWDGSCHRGEVSVAADRAGLAVTDVLVQPVEPVAFADDFLAEPNREAIWQPASGSWHIDIYRDGLTARDGGPPGASWYAAQGDDALSVTGYDFWEDYALEVSALARADTWMGLAFFGSGNDFTALAVLPGAERGKAELFRVRAGQRSVLAEAPASCPPELWHAMRVEASPTEIRAFLNGQLILTAPAHGSASGRVGLFASGPGKVHFDDFAAQGLESFSDPFASKPSGRWEFAAGRWQRDGGKLVGSASSDALALIAHRTWRDASLAATVKPGAASGGLVFRSRDEHNHYALLATARRWRLVRKLEGVETSLAEGDLPERSGRAGDALRLSVLSRGPQMIVQADGRELGRAYDFALREGRAGLLVRGHRKVAFDDVEAQSLGPDPAATVSLVRCEGESVPGPGHNQSLPAIGYLWRRSAGSWRPQALEGGGRAMRGMARTGQWAVLSHRQAAPGSVMLSATLPTAPEGTAGLAICTDGSDVATGYALAIAGGPQPSLRLLRRGEVVAELDALAADEVSWPNTLTLFRDGNGVGGAAGEVGLTYTDPQPLADGRPAIWVTAGQAVFDDLRLANLRATVDRFDRPAPGWVPSHGRWQVHSGMACIPWDYWTTGFGQPLALTWWRQPCTTDVVVDFNVSEYSEGYESGEHKHFPYHDISVALCGDGGDPDSGYRFVIAAGGTVTKLLRKGEVVAQTDDPRLRIVMGDHCNLPRAFDVRAAKRGSHISLAINGAPALQYEDPEPLAPGRIGLGAGDCAANFRDVVVYSLP
ncbi:MAG: hypothetical protein ACE5R4_03370 [Armatimonadota bacterium]